MGGVFESEGNVMAEGLRVGDIVKLKSGGLKMTIEKIAKFGYDKEEKAMCQWFDDKGVVKRDIFELTSLEKVSD